jgi:glycine/D-amino acid oxidase-like deaminating enzyme
VTVVERDSTYRHASTMLSDGNVRVQFNLPENIAMSQFAFEVLGTFADDMAVGDSRPDPGARHQGNLFLVDEAGLDAAHEGLARQREAGCEVAWLSAAEIAERFPPYRAEGIVGGTLGRLDGSVDPSAVLLGYRRKAAAMGASFVEGDVRRLVAARGRIAGVDLASGERLSAPVVVNGAGAWAAAIAETVGVDLPVEPVMRTVYVVETATGPGSNLPSVFLPGGLYAIPEHDGTFVMAWSLPDDPVGYDFTFRRDAFYERLWPELVRVMPAFDELRVTGGWTGLYAVNTLDGNAILGEWPSTPGFFLANGFSGHGFQQCHAVGRYLAELILEAPVSLDLSRFGPQRILDEVPVHEHAGRII